MADQRTRPTPKDKPSQPKQPNQFGRTGEGASSVLPHLKADQRARAVARIAKRASRSRLLALRAMAHSAPEGQRRPTAKIKSIEALIEHERKALTRDWDGEPA